MSNIDKNSIEKLFNRVNSPLSANQVLKELNLPRTRKGELKKSLKDLVSEGKSKKGARGGNFSQTSNRTNPVIKITAKAALKLIKIPRFLVMFTKMTTVPL